MTVDLEALRRSEPPSGGPGGAPRHATGRRVGAVLLLLALAAGAFWALRPVLFPARHVRTEAVRVVMGGEARGATAAEAAGWIEPDPYPVVVRPLVDGVVKSIEVLEGASVKANETVIARLESAALVAAVERAERTLAHREAHVGEAQAEADLAKALLDQRLDLRREVARLEGEVGVARAAKSTADAEATAAARALDAERAKLSAQESLEAAGRAGSTLTEMLRAEVAGAEATAAARRADLTKAQSSVAAGEALLALAVEARDRPEALSGALKTAEAHVAAAKAAALAATTDLAIARREAGWLTVVSPVDGVVLRREAAPGALVGPSAMPRGAPAEGGRMADSGDGGIVTIYDPKRLQARVDVPLGVVAGIGAGRKVELSVEAAGSKVVHGVVTRVQSQADPLKNTLQLKVRIEDPDPVLKPEMLVRARFLADAAPSGGAGGAPGASSVVRILVPRSALRGGAVFVLDPTGGGRARRVPVEKVGEDGDWVEVKGDVSRTHRVVLDEVDDGERVVGGDA